MEANAKPRRVVKSKSHAVGPALDATVIAEIAKIVKKSAIGKHAWSGGEVAAIGYLNGMACVFASFYVRLLAGDKAITEIAKPKGKSARKDVLAWYDEEFAHWAMDNSRGGVATLRHLFVFMFGLGMCESSGKYCRGRVRSREDIGVDTAPAGLFQTSYALRSAHPLLPKVVARYGAEPTGFLEVFREDVVCKPSDWENYGTGKSLEFQRLTKACPAFAVEYAALLLRHQRDYWESVTQRRVVLIGNCYRMLLQVQALVDKAIGVSTSGKQRP